MSNLLFGLARYLTETSSSLINMTHSQRISQQVTQLHDARNLDHTNVSLMLPKGTFVQGIFFFFFAEVKVNFMRF